MVWKSQATSTSTSWLWRRGGAPRRRLRGPERRLGQHLRQHRLPTLATTQAPRERGHGTRARAARDRAAPTARVRSMAAPRSYQCGRGRGTRRPRCSAQAALPAPAPRASLWLVRSIRFETQLQMGLPRIRRGRPGLRWTGPEQ
jgi:hypothetical protein